MRGCRKKRYLERRRKRISKFAEKESVLKTRVLEKRCSKKFKSSQQTKENSRDHEKD